MEEVYLCELCLQAFEPKEVKPGVRILQKFKGYEVDLRLQEFRKISRLSGTLPEFINFASPKGKRLLNLMHKAITK